MIKIWHVATHTTNIGDGALVSGIHRTIREDWDRPVEFIPDCLMEYENYMGNKRYDDALVARINTDADLLLIGGGGMLDGGRGDKNTGMGFDLPLELLEKIKIPVVFYAVGYNLFDKQIYWNLDKLKNYIEFVVAQKNVLFSVRNDGSYERLHEVLGGKISGLIEVPDPGLYVHTVDTEHPELLHGKENILIQLAGDNPFSRFSAGVWKYVPIFGEAVLKKRQIEQLCALGAALENISGKRNINYVLCPHLLRDFTVTGKFVDAIGRGFSRFTFNSTGVQRGTTAAGHFFDIYKNASLIIGMRGHSVICGVGLNTPTIALSSHSKVKGFMEKVGLSDRIVNLGDSGLVERLEKMVIEILDKRSEEVHRLRKISDDCRLKTREFNRRILRSVISNQ